MQGLADVITVKSNIQLTVLDRRLPNLVPDLAYDPVGNKDPARLHSEEYAIVNVQVIFQYLLGQAADSNGKLLF